MEYCNSLNHGHVGANWRVPTFKELKTAYAHGIYSLDDSFPSASPNVDNLGNLYAVFWSATTDANGTGNAWTVNLSDGGNSDWPKTVSFSVICVSP